MAVSNQEIADWLRANPLATDAEIAQAAASSGVTAQQLSLVTGVPVEQVIYRAQQAAPDAQIAAGNWNYGNYVDALRSGSDLGEQARRLADQNPELSNNAVKLFNEITAQQNAGTADYWSTGKTASKEAAAADFALRLAESGVSSLKDIGVRQFDQEVYEGETGSSFRFPVQQYYNKSTGEPLKDWDRLSQGINSNTKLNYQLDFTDDGVAIPYTTPKASEWVDFREGFVKPAALLAGSVILGPQVAGLIGGATGLTGAGLSAATGATLGAGGAALTGNDILKGALLGGAGGYLSGTLAAPPQDSIYSLANGTPNLDYMGGGQGLTSTGSANLASMGGAQGLQILAGLPSTTLSEALNSFAGVNPSVLSDMGLGTGITYVTPSGIVTENGTIIGGDVIGELGKNTGFDLTKWLNENIGTGIGDELAKIDTGIGRGMDATGSAASSTGGTATSGIADTAKAASSGLTLGKVLDAAKVAAIVGGVTGAAKSGTSQNAGFDVVPVPTDWRSPTYTQPAYQPLTPIDFGSRELLRGTQWEKYLNPVQPAAVQPVQMGMGYNQLMNTLQGGQGGSLTLNDIISGIQGQYGQTPSGTVG